MAADIDALVASAIARFNALSPEEQAAEREAQRQSWVRGEMGMVETSTMKKPAPAPADEWDAKAQQIKNRIDNATQMHHNAHENWSSEEFVPGISYLRWIHTAIDDLAAFGRAAERRGIERAAHLTAYTIKRHREQLTKRRWFFGPAYDGHRRTAIGVLGVLEKGIRALAQPASEKDV